MKRYFELKPDTAENQVNNRIELRKILDESQVGLSSKLSELLNIKLHYFDVGFFCKFTPEELDAEIKKEIGNAVESQKV